MARRLRLTIHHGGPLGGVPLGDRADDVRWSYLATRVGNYPSLDEVRAALDAL